MTENANTLHADRALVRPVILVDEWTLRYYGSCVRRILVGLTGSAYGAVLVGPEGQDTHNVLYPSVEFVRYPEFQLKLLNYKNRQILLDKLVRFKPTLLHGFWPGDAHLAQYLCQELNIPTVTTLFESPSRTALGQIPRNSVLAASSDPIYGSLMTGPVQPSRVIRIPLGTFVEDDTACFAVPGQMPSIVICESLNQVQDYEPLLNAVRHLLADGFDLSVGIMGEGPAERPIRKRVRELGLTATVTIVPPLRPVRPVFQGMDIFIHIKDRKRCNLALMEAMSVGLAVGGCMDTMTGLLQHEKTGLVFDPSDPMNIYAGLKQLLSFPEQARSLAEQARLFLRARHSVSGMVEGYLKAYRMALQMEQ